ncbi:hypothetical protein K3495_g4394 [Podosphaera aphanis]|nr:hypothetical protein K3495_g4394 [Podosphaera aphanis]
MMPKIFAVHGVDTNASDREVGSAYMSPHLLKAHVPSKVSWDAMAGERKREGGSRTAAVREWRLIIHPSALEPKLVRSDSVCAVRRRREDDECRDAPPTPGGTGSVLREHYPGRRIAM